MNNYRKLAELFNVSILGWKSLTEWEEQKKVVRSLAVNFVLEVPDPEQIDRDEAVLYDFINEHVKQRNKLTKSRYNRNRKSQEYTVNFLKRGWFWFNDRPVSLTRLVSREKYILVDSLGKNLSGFLPKFEIVPARIMLFVRNMATGIYTNTNEVILDPFEIQTRYVTTVQWKIMMGEDLVTFSGQDYIDFSEMNENKKLTFREAAAYCNALSRFYGLDEVYSILFSAGIRNIHTNYATITINDGLANPGFRIPSKYRIKAMNTTSGIKEYLREREKLPVKDGECQIKEILKGRHYPATQSHRVHHEMWCEDDISDYYYDKIYLRPVRSLR
ncbi:MAG: hypothetical protein ABIG89_02000 [Candidatus Woesearchaeota archaeon]